MLGMDRSSQLNELNWKNLIEMYEDVFYQSTDIIKVDEPDLSIFSSRFCWPNFTIVSDRIAEAEGYLSALNDSVLTNTISPIFLIRHELLENGNLTAEMENLGIRQIEVWPAIFYDLTQGIPENQESLELQVRIVSDNPTLDLWHEIARKVLFSNKELPVLGFLSQKYVLLLGYLDNKPVATTLVFLGSTGASVHMVAVDPEFRRQGIGKSIFTKALQLCLDNGYKFVFSQASKMGRKPWLDLGFQISGYFDIFWKVGHAR